MDLNLLAKELDEALLGRREIPPLTRTHGDFDLETAYRIQEIGIRKRLDRGERIVGYKMGLTSAAKRVQMNLGAPIYGVLTDVMQLQDALNVIWKVPATQTGGWPGLVRDRFLAFLMVLGTGFLLLVALVVVIGQAPFSSTPPFDIVVSVKDWLFDYPMLAGIRAIILGVAFGAIATSLRVLLGFDRPYLD